MQERISLLRRAECHNAPHFSRIDGICLQFGVKPPGLTADLSKVAMRFSYEAAFGKSAANGYERLLLDAMSGDATLFSHRDGIEAACAFHSGP
jgi:glucose-6-phosphate 1-dehydrogenase